MLVLSRKVGEQIIIGDRVIVTVTRISNNRITLGIDAPDDVRVLRSELAPRQEASTDGLSEAAASASQPLEAVELQLCGSHASLSC